MPIELLNDLEKAVLILNLRNVEDLAAISDPIASIAKRTRSRLLVIIFHPTFELASGTGSWAAVQKLLTHAYVQATTVAQDYDKILMTIDVILRGNHTPLEGICSLDDDWDKIFYSGDLQGLPTLEAWREVDTIQLPDITDTASLTNIPHSSHSSVFPVVALGGTFDHLHPGHKILLSMAAWITEKKIIVGVTDDTLLVNKTHKDLLEPLAVRLDAVRKFLSLFKPGLIYDVIPIADVYGPTGWDPDVQALVVSKETLPGAASIASLRAQKSFPPLQTFVIDVISAVSSDLGTDDPNVLKHAKMSSTFIREWIYNRNSSMPETPTDAA